MVAESISRLLKNDERPDFAMMKPLPTSANVLQWPD